MPEFAQVEIEQLVETFLSYNLVDTGGEPKHDINNRWRNDEDQLQYFDIIGIIIIIRY